MTGFGITFQFSESEIVGLILIEISEQIFTYIRTFALMAIGLLLFFRQL